MQHKKSALKHWVCNLGNLEFAVSNVFSNPAKRQYRVRQASFDQFRSRVQRIDVAVNLEFATNALSNAVY